MRIIHTHTYAGTYLLPASLHSGVVLGVLLLEHGHALLVHLLVLMAALLELAAALLNICICMYIYIYKCMFTCY
jgi:hypothetical protein